MFIPSAKKNLVSLGAKIQYNIEILNFFKERLEWVNYLLRNGIEDDFRDWVKEKEQTYFKQCLTNSDYLPQLTSEENKIFSESSKIEPCFLKLDMPLFREIFLWHFAEDYSSNMNRRVQAIAQATNLKVRLEQKVAILQEKYEQYQEKMHSLQNKIERQVEEKITVNQKLTQQDIPHLRQEVWQKFIFGRLF